MKRVLIVAFHFPPLSGTSGVQRALRFTSYLPDYGWEPIVLTASEWAYEQRSNDLLGEIPEGTRVIRAPTLDTKRHLSIGGRYPNFLAIPDRWHWWRYTAIPLGLRAIRKYKPQVIWSTYPIATAHQIGVGLSRSSGVPLVADFRDPMAQSDYPADRATWQSFERIERTTISAAAACTFTTPGAIQLYKNRYPDQEQRFSLIENGYDESAFDQSMRSDAKLNSGKLTLLHSGIVYPSERDPTRLFEALSVLRREAPTLYSKFVLRFRAPGHDGLLQSLAKEYNVESALQIEPKISYEAAAREMQQSDGLLVLQASNCNAQIPAKFYEYLYTRRPMLILTDPEGDTAWAARTADIESIAKLDDTKSIVALLRRFIEGRMHAVPSESAVRSCSRRERTRTLANLFNTFER